LNERVRIASDVRVVACEVRYREEVREFAKNLCFVRGAIRMCSSAKCAGINRLR